MEMETIEKKHWHDKFMKLAEDAMESAERSIELAKINFREAKKYE